MRRMVVKRVVFLTACLLAAAISLSCGNNKETTNPEINPPCVISVTSPGAGAIWNVGETRTIRWTSYGSSGSVRIELWRGVDSLCVISDSTADDGSYDWQVYCCEGADASDYLIKITDDEGNCYAFSHSLTIQQCCDLEVFNPQAGALWTRGDSHTIQWDGTGGGGNVSIELWRGDTLFHTIVASTANTGKYEWVVDCFGGESATDYYIVVRSQTCSARSGQFEIEHCCNIEVLAPTGGVVWSAGTSQTVRWEPNYGSASVKIDLWRAGNGGTWLCTIADNTTNDGYYDWTVDCCGAASGQYFLKIMDNGVAGCYADSPVFSIDTCGP